MGLSSSKTKQRKDFAGAEHLGVEPFTCGRWKAAAPELNAFRLLNFWHLGPDRTS